MSTTEMPGGAVAAPPPAGPRAAVRGRATAVLGAVPVLALLGLLLAAIVFDGAFAVRHWGPVAVLAFALVAACGLRIARGPALVAVGALWALGAWTTLSALWSPFPDTAVRGGVRDLFYAALLTVPVAVLRSNGAARLASRAATAALALLTAGTLVALLIGTTGLMLAGRLAEPVGYRNGTAALFVLAAVALACAAASRVPGVLARASAFGGASVALGLAYMTQSRGILLGLAAGTFVAVAMGPDRLRRAYAILGTALAVALASGPLRAPWDRWLDDRVTAVAPTRDAAQALVVLGLVAGLVALVVAAFDRGLRAPASVGRLRTAGVVGLVALAVLGGVAGVARVGNPIAFADEKLEEFRSAERVPTDGSRLGSTGGQRYELWRVALGEFGDAPLAGAGEGGFVRAWYAERRSIRNVTTAHSLPLEAMAEGGLVAFGLLLAVLGAAVTIVVRGRALDEPRRRLASVPLAGAAVIVGQSTIDWFWSIPGLMGLAALLAGVGLAVLTTDLPRARGRALAPVAVLAAVGAVLTCLLLLSDAYTRQAREARGVDPAAQLRAARRAASLNPLAPAARYLAAGALETQGRRDEGREELLAALRREPDSFVTMALLGDLEFRARDREASRRWYRRALARNPRDAGLQRLASR